MVFNYGSECALLSLWVIFNPRVFVYTSHSLDPENPVYTYFVVRNEGHFNIHDVTFSCSIEEIELISGTKIIAEAPLDNRFSDPSQTARIIAPGEEYSALLPLSGLKDNKFKSGVIAVGLSFRPSFRRRDYKKKHRFEICTAKDGKRHWLHQPLNK